jgi:V/A-type H+-transporting ATPase subunit C
MRTSEKLSHIYPLSVLPVIDFIIRKKKEVDFIRIIVKGKDNGLSEGMIKELLVLWWRLPP